ncbi:hypothetical protein CEXT_27411 [Caerostris extrusa]|uniref:Uncharacterized protein n=1 Tax=Caerostris extrusa TaxID=172846 RepID=A0AAV4SX10_CAEEX|nr:hypothetical protein CEXT_27411 [Caerostris extrusa]
MRRFDGDCVSIGILMEVFLSKRHAWPIISHRQKNYKSNSQPQLHTLGTNFVPYTQAALGTGLLYGQGFPGVVGFGLPVGVYSSGQLNRALGAAGLGFHGGNYFGKQGLAKGAGGQEYGLQNGFAGLYDNKGGYGNQFIGGNSNIFSKEKIYSHNKNFGSGVKGGFELDMEFKVDTKD